MINQWKGRLLDHAAEWGLPATGAWTYLVYNNYQPNCSDIDILWFHDGRPNPRVVTKICREPNRPEREFANLRRVYSVAPRWTPRPLRLEPHEPFWTLWMEGVPGARFEGGEAPADLRAIADTIASIHAALRQPRPAVPDPFRVSVADPLRFLADFGSSPAVAAGCRDLLGTITPEWLLSLPSIPQHGDLYDGNLLHGDGVWYVVDWETFGAIDLPAYDLFTALLSILLRDGADSGRWRPALVAEAPGLLRRYAEKIKMSAADLSSLLPLTLANWFYLQARDGRIKFTDRMYPVIASYFENRSAWERVFCSRAAA